MTTSRRRLKRGDVIYGTSLPETLVYKIKDEALKRKVEQKQLVLSALTEFLDPNRLERDEELIIRRINKLDLKLKTIANKLNILSETLSLFIQVWFSNTYEIPEEQKDTAQMQGERRYRMFIKLLGNMIK